MTRPLLTRLVLGTTLALGAWGCEDDDGPSPSDAGGDRAADSGAGTDGPAAETGGGTEAGSEAGRMDGGGDGGDAGPALTAPQMRGKYLVDVALGCGDCHTPRGPMGAPDMSKYLAGVSCFLDIMPMAPNVGCVSTKNLTNHETGLKNVTDDAAVKDMFLNGKRPDGKFLSSFMPYYEYHNLTAADADAIVAYLRVVPGIENRPTATEPPLANPPVAAAPIDPAMVPAVGTTTQMESATRGRYLAMVACINCHTPEKAMAPPAETPIDATKYFAGGRAFPAAAFGLPMPPFPMVIYTQNLTQHMTGIMGWTADDVVKVLKEGKDKMGKGVCPPMPAGPMGNFGRLTDGDARDIANYIVSLPGVMNMLPNQCELPAMP